jgi:hypothetical protein
VSHRWTACPDAAFFETAQAAPHLKGKHFLNLETGKIIISHIKERRLL